MEVAVDVGVIVDDGDDVVDMVDVGVRVALAVIDDDGVALAVSDDDGVVDSAGVLVGVTMDAHNCTPSTASALAGDALLLRDTVKVSTCGPISANANTSGTHDVWYEPLLAVSLDDTLYSVVDTDVGPTSRSDATDAVLDAG